MRPLLTIKGLTVKELTFDSDDDSVFVQFQENAHLRAWVKFTIQPENTPLTAFTGKTVEEVIESEGALDLLFQDGLSITLDFTARFGDEYAVEILLYSNYSCDPPVSCVMQKGEL